MVFHSNHEQSERESVVNFPTAVKLCLSKYVSFRGRAPRSEFWYFQLFACLVFAAFVALLLVAPETSRAVGIASCLTCVALFLPGLAVGVRRLQDRNRSKWHFFWFCVPYVGGLVVFIWFCMPGSVGDNRFGPDPRAINAGRQASA
jgi:uncharacterized membrane protein YhaH (DUF805 family)